MTEYERRPDPSKPNKFVSVIVEPKPRMVYILVYDMDFAYASAFTSRNQLEDYLIQLVTEETDGVAYYTGLSQRPNLEHEMYSVRARYIENLTTYNLHGWDVYAYPITSNHT